MARHINACMPIYTHSLSTWQQINTYTLCNSVMYGIMPICKQKQTFVALKLVLIIEFSPDLLCFSTLIYFSLIPHPLFFHPIDSFRIIELWQPAALYVLQDPCIESIIIHIIIYFIGIIESLCGICCRAKSFDEDTLTPLLSLCIAFSPPVPLTFSPPFPLSPSLLSLGDLLNDDPFFFSKGERVLWASSQRDPL